VNGKVIKLELTPEQVGQCRYGPSRLLLLAIADSSKGDTLIVEGLEEITPSQIVRDVLEDEGFEIKEFRSDPPFYTIRAVKEE
jgi:hypothetical protein